MKTLKRISLTMMAWTFVSVPGMVSAQSGTINGHEYMDLGLPSGLKWATCNVGASSPSDRGDYFAWGETATKANYKKENCTTWEKSLGALSGKAKYDAARANWGGSWRLPSKAECDELREQCTWMWTSYDGHKGYEVIGPNGKSVFLPAAGWRCELSNDGAGYYGRYWTSTPDETDAQSAYFLNFFSGYRSVGWRNRCDGLSVRPVSE